MFDRTGPVMSDRGPAGPADPLLLLIGVGGQRYREYLLAPIAARYRVHLFLEAEPTWERRYLAGWTVLESMRDTIEAGPLCAAAAEVAAREPVHGVLSWDEARILQSAKVAAAVKLPGGDPDAVLRCRDKHKTRRALDAAGVPQARSVLVAGLDQAVDAAEGIGYPVVLKPRAMGASLGVVRADNAAELRARFGFAHDAEIPGSWRYDQGVLIEEYLDGPEISVDSAVHDGQVLPMFVARKQVDYPPYFEETGHVVDARDPLLTDPALARVLAGAHEALGFSDGVTHAEFRLTAAGPKVVEVNARLGGDLIPYLGLRSSGIDPGLAAAAVACGNKPSLAASTSRVAAVRFYYPDAAGTVIGDICFDGALPPEIDQAVTLAAPGDVVSPPPEGTLFGRIAFATALADSQAACNAALDAAGAALKIQPK